MDDTADCMNGFRQSNRVAVKKLVLSICLQLS